MIMSGEYLPSVRNQLLGRDFTGLACSSLQDTEPGRSVWAHYDVSGGVGAIVDACAGPAGVIQLDPVEEKNPERNHKIRYQILTFHKNSPGIIFYQKYFDFA